VAPQNHIQKDECLPAESEKVYIRKFGLGKERAPRPTGVYFSRLYNIS